MKYLKFAVALFLAGAIGFSGCKGGDKGGAGASSPEKLFEQMKGKERDSFGDIAMFVAPDELPFVAFSMDFMMAFMTKFSPDKTVADQYMKIRAKYKLPDNTGKKMNVNMNDQEAMMKYASETYGKIDVRGFLKDIEALVEKMPGAKEKSSMEKVPYTELKDVKIDGDKATGVVVLDNQKTEPLHFRKVDGKWYLSIKESFLQK